MHFFIESYTDAMLLLITSITLKKFEFILLGRLYYENFCCQLWQLILKISVDKYGESRSHS